MPNNIGGREMNQYLNLAGRILLALIFVVSGVGKLASVAGTMQYMQAMGVPGILLWPTVAFELLGGLALVAGYKTRPVALAFAAFCVISALLFHRNFADQTQMIMFLKNLAMAGGFLLLASTGATAYAVNRPART
jgi:putative oxidoreductase